MITPNCRRPLFVLLALAAPAAAQSNLYDAGPAGTPPAAPSPVVQGWQETITGSCVAGPLSPDPGGALNAWGIFDPGSGEIRYDKDVSYVSTDYTVELVMLPLAGEFTLEIDSGDLITNSVFRLQLEVVGSDIHVHSGTATIVCPGAVDGAYHTWRFTGRHYDLAIEYDGTPLGTVGETAWGLWASGEGIRWGTFGGTVGRARVHRVEMTLDDWGPVGSTYCGPAVPNSSGRSARIEAEGDTAYPNWGLRLRALDLPPQSFGFFIVGSNPDSVPMAGGSQGTLCVGGNLGRFSSPIQVQNSGALGTLWLDVDLGQLPTTPNTSVGVGETWHFQAWHRDANPGVTSNFTDAVAVTF